jgi:hypothetical protein
MALAHRIRQALRGLRPVLPADLNTVLAEALTPDQRVAFKTLSAYDQTHLYEVYRQLVDQGVTDHNLLTAALLHDLGKSARNGRVRLADRTISVILLKVAPVLLERLARLPAPLWRRGIALSVHHPMLGATWAADLGCSARTCWLIEHHADFPPPDDPDLLLLIQVDAQL